MNTMLEWLKEPITQSVLAGFAVFAAASITAWYNRARQRAPNIRTLRLIEERVAQVEKMIVNLATTCADNTARLAGIEEYLQDKQLAAAMFGKRHGEPDRPLLINPQGEAQRLGNVEFRAGDFPVMLKPEESPGEQYIAEQERLMKAKIADKRGPPITGQPAEGVGSLSNRDSRSGPLSSAVESRHDPRPPA